MKTVKTATGPFSERPHFELYEIENTCSEALRSTGCYPDHPEPIRIERFIEKKFGVTPEYEQLPDGVLGFTKFRSGGVQAVVVSIALDQDGSVPAERRIRSTLAHEAGHGLFHSHLFASDKPVVPSEGGKPEILCRDIQEAVQESQKYDGRWWEFQANRAIGGLLMPRRLVQKAVKPFSNHSDAPRHWTVDLAQRRKIVIELAKVFDVNPVVAQLRLDELFPMRSAG